MKCPIDNSDLVMTDRQGIEIDYCPKCRGVWLDRGELDKLIDRSAPAAPPPQKSAPYQEQSQQYYRPQSDHQYREHRRDDDDDDDHRHRHGGPKRKSFLGDIFDF